MFRIPAQANNDDFFMNVSCNMMTMWAIDVLFVQLEADNLQKVLEEWVPFVPSEPSPILCAFYDAIDEGSFWLSMVCRRSKWLSAVYPC